MVSDGVGVAQLQCRKIANRDIAIFAISQFCKAGGGGSCVEEDRY